MDMEKNKSEGIRVHSLQPYDRGGKVHWLLAEIGQPYHTRWLDGKNKEHESPDYLKLNPMGRVPVAEINNVSLFESGAICAYLADLYLEKGLAPDLNAPERAAYQQWMYFAVATLDPIQTRIMIIEDIPEGALRTEKETALLQELQDACEALDSALQKNAFLVGRHFTAADICVGYHLYFLLLWPELASVINKFPLVISYLDRLKARPAALKSKVFSYEG